MRTRRAARTGEVQNLRAGVRLGVVGHPALRPQHPLLAAA
eukprot:SAG11_NODE_22378_length_407_cov_0.672078_1_plen_39_part_10